VLRPASLEVLTQIETGEVLAQDLFLWVTFEALSPDVPTYDSSTRVQHKDRVVDDVFH
jgi:hypothetical protein